MNINSISLKIIIVTIACFLIAYCSMRLIKNEKGFPISVIQGYTSQYFGQKTPVTVNKSISAKSLETITIDIINTDITFKSAQSENVNISLNGKYFNVKKPDIVLQSNITDKTLTLAINEESAKNLINYEGKMLIEIPNNIKKLTLKTKFGDIKINSTNLTSIKMNSISGDTKIANANLDSLEVNAVDGNVDFTGTAKKIGINTISGDNKLMLANDDPNINITSNSGDIIVGFQNTPNIAVTFLTVDGSIRLAQEFGSSSQTELKTFKLGKGKGILAVETLSGDLHIVKY